MKHLNKFKEFESSLYASDMERLSSFYEGDKIEIQITNTSDDKVWYKDLLGSKFISVKSGDKFKVIPPKLLSMFNIQVKEYPDYNNKVFLQSGILYVNLEDCKIIKKLSEEINAKKKYNL